MKTMIMVLILASRALTSLAQDRSAVIRNVGVEGFKHAMDSLQDEVIVDLRTPEELKQGKIPGAIVIDYFGSNFESAIQALDRNKTYLLYCAGGGRSGETSELMEKLGFQRVYNLETGFTGWVKRKMPVE
jgi:rhodanese-related sulfurtransferase